MDLNKHNEIVKNTAQQGKQIHVTSEVNTIAMTKFKEHSREMTVAVQLLQLDQRGSLSLHHQ